MTLRSQVMGTPANAHQRAVIAELRRAVAEGMAAVEAADKALADPELDRDTATRVIRDLQQAMPRSMDTGSGPGWSAPRK